MKVFFIEPHENGMYYVKITFLEVNVSENVHHSENRSEKIYLPLGSIAINNESIDSRLRKSRTEIDRNHKRIIFTKCLLGSQ